ncbi:GIY-YIG nuclease family protein [Flavobacterium sp. 1355]|uniref:GIY-YIG nuclease family protein n=1 Tax=Flavobacterium sp. 1355 TaxID=2806571 RepID=UPI001AE6270C
MIYVLVYIIYSKTFDIYYKGFSEDVPHRLLYHNENRSKYTSNKGPWEFQVSAFSFYVILRTKVHTRSSAQKFANLM